MTATTGYINCNERSNSRKDGTAGRYRKMRKDDDKLMRYPFR